MVGWTTQSRINCEIKLKIYGIRLLHSKERWVTIISIRLLKIELVYDQEQNATAFNQRDYWQIKEGKIFQ